MYMRSLPVTGVELTRFSTSFRHNILSRSNLRTINSTFGNILLERLRN